MGFDEGYSVDQIERSFSLDDLEATEAVEEGYSIEGILVPEQRVPDYNGVNSADMEICRTKNDEWLFAKPASANYGRAGKANIMASLMYDRLDVPSPDVGVDEETVFIEHLGQLDDLRGSNCIDDAIIEKLIAGKVITGDPDIGGNIGFKDGSCYIYDFDQAGGPIHESFDSAANFVETSSIGIELEDVNQRASSMAQELDLDDYAAELEKVLDENLPGSYGFNDLDLKTVYDNIEYVRENNATEGDRELVEQLK